MNTVRETVTAVRAELAIGFATFAVCVVTVSTLAVVLLSITNPTPAGPFSERVGGGLFLAIILATAIVAMRWLLEDGYNRLNLDRNRAPLFAWLTVIYLPLAGLPTRIAIQFGASHSLIQTRTIDALFLLCCLVLAGWLTVGRGLEQPTHLIDVTRTVIVGWVTLGAISIALMVLFGTVPTAGGYELEGALTALTIQAIALGYGLRPVSLPR